MIVRQRSSGSRALRAVACCAALLWMGIGAAQAAGAESNAGPSAALGARYALLKDGLGHNQFNRPLHLESSEGKKGVRGEIFALVNFPFATAGAALNTPAQWCEVLILHLNTKHCRPSADAQGAGLQLFIGKKFDQPVDDAYKLDFDYRVAARTTDFLQVKLSANEGPLGTSDYRIVLEATPAEEGKTFIRLAYSYSYGLLGQLAMQTYLGTVGRSKVGFTQVDAGADNPPRSVGGMRGLVERNTMRYYLAIESYLGALSAAPRARVEKSLRDWFAATEAYPRQLHEMEQVDYLAMKRKEYSRQLAAVVN